MLLGFVLMAGSDPAFAQSTRLKEYRSAEHKVSIGFPEGWTLQPPQRNEVWLASGDLRGGPAGCFVRMSKVGGLQLLTPDAYFRENDESKWVKLVSISTPDVKVHRFDFSLLGGKNARLIIYSGTDDGVKVGNLVHQTLDGSRILTLACFVEQRRFTTVYSDFDSIAASFKFLN